MLLSIELRGRGLRSTSTRVLVLAVALAVSSACGTAEAPSVRSDVDPAVLQVDVEPSVLELDVHGASFPLASTVRVEAVGGAATDVVWTSSDVQVAVVDAVTGLLIAVSSGTAVVTAASVHDPTASDGVVIRVSSRDASEPAPGLEPEPESDSEPGGRWRPGPGTSWQWQLQGTIDTSLDVDVYDIDLFDTSASLIAELHADGRRVVCYFSAGSYEPWRPDADAFPEAVKGRKMDGWDELWLDVRRIELLAPVVEGRLDLAVAKGCDAVEPDNVDGYANDTGFALSYDDQIAYNMFLAAEAHARGLSIALKNDVEQVADLVDVFDFAVNEECFSWNECEALVPFVEAGKAVLGVEYELGTGAFCSQANAMDFDFMRKNLDLGVYREPCR
jgi:hypothetical protein